MKTAIVLASAVIAQAIGNTCLSKGMKYLALSIDTTQSINPMILLQALGNPMIWVGTFFLILFFSLFSAALTWSDLSYVLPVTAFGYILNVGFAHYFLNEPISGMRWMGTALIIVGVVLVSRSSAGAAQGGSMRGSAEEGVPE